MCVRARQRHPRHNIFFRRGSGLGSFIPSVQCLDCSSALASELGEFCLFSDIKFRELIELRFAVVLPTNHHYEYRLLTFSAKAGSGGCDCSSSKEAYANLRKFFTCSTAASERAEASKFSVFLSVFNASAPIGMSSLHRSC